MGSECIGRNMADLVREGVIFPLGYVAGFGKTQRVTITLVPRSGNGSTGNQQSDF